MLGQNRNYVQQMDYRPQRDDPEWIDLMARLGGIRRDEFGVAPPEESQALGSSPSGAPDFMSALGTVPATAGVTPPPPPGDPLARPIPRAPLPVDVAGIRKEEEEALTKERGPRIKPNPKGIKGVLLALAKGGAGLAEGWSRSRGSFMDAIPAMTEAASRRIDRYRTNVEDSEPFDAELKDRLQQRLEPELQEYGRKRQIYGDDLDRYGLEKKEETEEDARRHRDRAFGLSEKQLESQDADRRRTDERLERDSKRRFDAKVEQIRTTAATAIRNHTSKLVKDTATAQTRALDKQLGVVSAKSKELYAERRRIQSELAKTYGMYGDEIPANADPVARQAKARLQDLENEIEDLEDEKEAIVNRYTSVAQTLMSTAPAGGASVTSKKGITYDQAMELIDEAERSGKFNAEAERTGKTPAEVAEERRDQVRAKAGQ